MFAQREKSHFHKPCYCFFLGRDEILPYLCGKIIKMFAYEEENYDFGAVRLDGYGE